MMTVEQLLNTKGREVATIEPDATVAMAAHRLRARRVGALVVSRGGGVIAGIISERDIVRGLAEHGRDLLDRRVSDLMTRSVTTCSPTDSVRDLMAVMTQRRIRHLPVASEGTLCGIVSIGDVVKNRLEEMQLETGVLRDAYLAVH
jgi:CBS domain-containing protein